MDMRDVIAFMVGAFALFAWGTLIILTIVPLTGPWRLPPLLLGIHGYPNDYWRFTPEGLRVVLEAFDDAWVAGIGDPEMPLAVVGVAARGRELGLSLERLPALAAAQARYAAAEHAVRVGPLRVAPAELARIALGEGRRLVAARLRRSTLRR